MIDIGLEAPLDRDAVWAVVARAFPTPDEAKLVDQLRADGDVVYSLVAREGDAVVGHALFSRMTAPFRALGLAPVATAQAQRRRGLAARLIKDGIDRARRDGWEAVFVLGDPAYYGRFGFDAALAAGFSSPYAGAHFMVLPLAGALPVFSGAVAYPRAFAALD